jgi:ferrous iron transport protein B
MAQIAMIVGLVGQRGGQYVAIVFGTLFLILVLKGMLMNKFMKGKSPEILVEIPPYRIPDFAAVLKKLWMRLHGFLKEAIPYVLLGVLAVNMLYSLKIISFAANIFAPVFIYLWGLPEDVISAMLVGFLRKDVAVGMLAPLGLSTRQLIVSTTILAIYFPCVATFMVLVKELGWRDMLKAACIMIFVAGVAGTGLNILLGFFKI